MEGISLSSWGNCSHRSPDREWEMIGRKKFFTDYRFYFAFENTFCDDYVSEKAFVALNFSRHYGVIPVVYGAAPYRSILPAGSFIDVSTFESVSALAKYMKSLALPENKMKLQSYYLWQYRYFTDQSDNSRVVLGKEEKYRFIYRDTLIVLVCLFFFRNAKPLPKIVGYGSKWRTREQNQHSDQSSKSNGCLHLLIRSK